MDESKVGTWVSQGYPLWVTYWDPPTFDLRPDSARRLELVDSLHELANAPDAALHDYLTGPFPVVAWRVRSGYVPEHINAVDGQADGTAIYGNSEADSLEKALGRARKLRDWARTQLKSM